MNQNERKTKTEQLLEIIIEAIQYYNNSAELEEIYEYFKEYYNGFFSQYKEPKSVIRKIIYMHSSDSDYFRVEPGDAKDIFYSVKGKGEGFWGLRNYSSIEKVKEENKSKIKSFSYGEIVSHVHKYIRSKGFLYSKAEVTNLFLSIKTKPFVILSGISGTGKTKIVQWFAESIGATEKNGQFTIIPVRPDWNDGSDLLGYVDIKGDFKEGPLTKVLNAAKSDSNTPYIVLLDEMNLARVEYYFSDILSVMESRKWENGKIVSSKLLSKDTTDIEDDLTLPNNVYIFGTVNMDETTHPFSKKVLDRANTIEFNKVDLENLDYLKELKEIDPIEISNTNLKPKYLHLKDVYEKYPYIVENVTKELVEINSILETMYAHVGYRVRDEICFYLAYNEEGKLLTFNEALDHCILQKILPRLSGSDIRIDRVLKSLYRLFTNIEYDEQLDNYERDIENAKYPQSAKKVLEMIRRLEDDGFTSFWIS